MNDEYKLTYRKKWAEYYDEFGRRASQIFHSPSGHEKAESPLTDHEMHLYGELVKEFRLRLFGNPFDDEKRLWTLQELTNQLPAPELRAEVAALYEECYERARNLRRAMSHGGAEHGAENGQGGAEADVQIRLRSVEALIKFPWRIAGTYLLEMKRSQVQKEELRRQFNMHS